MEMILITVETAYLCLRRHLVQTLTLNKPQLNIKKTYVSLVLLFVLKITHCRFFQFWPNIIKRHYFHKFCNEKASVRPTASF